MDVVEFLEKSCWGNQLATVDLTTKGARTKLLHSDRLATVVLRWSPLPQTTGHSSIPIVASLDRCASSKAQRGRWLATTSRLVLHVQHDGSKRTMPLAS